MECDSDSVRLLLFYSIPLIFTFIQEMLHSPLSHRYKPLWHLKYFFPCMLCWEEILQIRSEKQVSGCTPNLYMYKRYLRLSFCTLLEFTPGSCQIALIRQLAFRSLPDTGEMTYAGSPASHWPRMGPGRWIFVVTSDRSSSSIAFLSFVRARGQ